MAEKPDTELNHKLIEAVAKVYWQSEQLKGSSDAENRFRAQAELGLIKDLSLKSASKVASQIVTIFAAVGLGFTAVGVFLVWAYLSSIGAPMPPLDSSISILALSVFVVLAILFLLIPMFIVLPFVLKDPEQMKEFFPMLPRSGRAHAKDYWKDYVAYLLPFLLTLIPLGLLERWRNGWIIFLFSSCLFSGLLSRA